MPTRTRASFTAPLFLSLFMQSAPSLAEELRHTRFRLENGLTVILHEDHRLPLVGLSLWYHVGSKDEPAGRSGFAHLFEHLMFMGTEKVPYPGFDAAMEAEGGSNNASTSSDRTNYYESGPRHLLETFLYLEADRMASVGRSMTREKLDAQREVVRNERRQSYENRPYGKASLEIPNRIYPRDHPYHDPVIGSHEDLERATVEDVKDFFRAFYFPGNASLVIAGDFDPEAARDLVMRHFSPIPAGPAAVRKPAPLPARLAEALEVTLEDAVELPLSIIVWHSPPVYAEGDADLDVLASILGSGKSSRLYKSLVYEKKIAQEIAVYQTSKVLGSEFRIFAYARPEASQDEIEAEIARDIERLKAEGPTPREVERARNRIETAFWQEVQSISERAELLNAYNFHFDDPGAIARDRARYDAVTPESVRRWATEVLQPGSRLTLRVVPRRG